MEFDMAIDECDISSTLKEVLKSEGYDSVYKVFCEPIVILLDNGKISTYWGELVDLFAAMSVSGVLDKMVQNDSLTLADRINRMPINKGIIYILDRAGYKVISDIWHAGKSKVNGIEGMTPKAFNELTSYMKTINLELK